MHVGTARTGVSASRAGLNAESAREIASRCFALALSGGGAEGLETLGADLGADFADARLMMVQRFAKGILEAPVVVPFFGGGAGVGSGSFASLSSSSNA